MGARNSLQLQVANGRRRRSARRTASSRTWTRTRNNSVTCLRNYANRLYSPKVFRATIFSCSGVMERRVAPGPRATSDGSVLIFMTWAEALSRYIDYLNAAGGSAGTVRLRLHHARRFADLAPCPRLVTSEMLLAVIGTPDLAPESRSSRRASARKLFGWLHDEGIIETNPAAQLPKVRVPQGLPRPAPDGVIAHAVLNADVRTRAMLMLGAYSGLRCCEIAALHRSEISGDVMRITGKGGKVRMVPLHPLVAEMLPTTDGYLFPGQHDGHLSPLWVCKIIGNALPTGWTAHTLRHRFASAAYAAERDLLAVQELLGHASPVTTRRYTAIPNDALRRAVLAAGPVEVGLACAQ